MAISLQSMMPVSSCFVRSKRMCSAARSQCTTAEANPAAKGGYPFSKYACHFSNAPSVTWVSSSKSSRASVLDFLNQGCDVLSRNTQLCRIADRKLVQPG